MLKPTGVAATLVATFVLSLCIATRAQESNPAAEKFKQDIKASVVSGSLTIAQVQVLKENLEILKNAKAEQQPAAPIDLLTPYHAVSKMKATMARCQAAGSWNFDGGSACRNGQQKAPGFHGTRSAGEEAWEGYFHSRHAWRADGCPSRTTARKPKFVCNR